MADTVSRKMVESYERVYSYIATWNNYEGDPKTLLNLLFTIWNCQYLVGQAQIGQENNTPHLQFCFILKHPRSVIQLNSPFANFKIWLGACYNFGKRLLEYVKSQICQGKNKKRIAGPWQFGQKIQGHPSTYKPVKPNFNVKMSFSQYQKLIESQSNLSLPVRPSIPKRGLNSQQFVKSLFAKPSLDDQDSKDQVKLSQDKKLRKLRKMSN